MSPPAAAHPYDTRYDTIAVCVLHVQLPCAYVCMCEWGRACIQERLMMCRFVASLMQARGLSIAIDDFYLRRCVCVRVCMCACAYVRMRVHMFVCVYLGSGRGGESEITFLSILRIRVPSMFPSEGHEFKKSQSSYRNPDMLVICILYQKY